MLSEVYEVFGLTYSAALSTRPESRLGTDAEWDEAEAALTDALNDHQAKTGQRWEVTFHHVFKLSHTSDACIYLFKFHWPSNACVYFKFHWFYSDFGLKLLLSLIGGLVK